MLELGSKKIYMGQLRFNLSKYVIYQFRQLLICYIMYYVKNDTIKNLISDSRFNLNTLFIIVLIQESKTR